MQKIILLVLLCLQYTIFFSQTKEKVKKDNTLNVPVKSWHLRFSPLQLLDLEATLVTGAEYRVKERLAVSMDAGYVLYSVFLQNKESVSGILLKPAIRYYSSENKRLYLEGEVMYKLVRYGIHDWVGRDCVNEIPSYYELQKFKLNKNVFALNGKIGRVSKLNKKNDNLSIDYFIGLGVRYKKFAVANSLPNTCYSLPDALDIGGNGSNTQIFPNYTMGFRLLIKLKTKAVN